MSQKLYVLKMDATRQIIYPLVAKKNFNAKNELEFIWFAYIKVMMSYSFRLECILCFLLPFENEN